MDDLSVGTITGIITAIGIAVAGLIAAIYKGIKATQPKIVEPVRPHGVDMALIREQITEVNRWTREEDRERVSTAETKRTIATIAETITALALSATRDREDRMRHDAETRRALLSIERACESLLKDDRG